MINQKRKRADERVMLNRKRRKTMENLKVMRSRSLNATYLNQHTQLDTHTDQLLDRA